MSTAATKMSTTKILVESSILVAIAVVLSMIKLIDLPYGGSVTIACMLPIIIASYRHGLKWGLLAGFVFAVTQQLLGVGTLSYVTTWQSILAVVLLDYILAYMLTGYNATYMVPETIVTSVAAYYIGTVLDFRNEQIAFLRRTKNAAAPVYQWIGGLILAIAFVIDSVLVFSKLQNPETGDFDITGLAAVNWVALIVLTAAALASFLVLRSAGKNRAKSGGAI